VGLYLRLRRKTTNQTGLIVLRDTAENSGMPPAVAKVGPLEFGGFLAWLAWLFMHLVFLIGFENKLTVLEGNGNASAVAVTLHFRPGDPRRPALRASGAEPLPQPLPAWQWARASTLRISSMAA
jgi:hypothetical protein